LRCALSPPATKDIKRRWTSKQKHQDDADRKQMKNNEKAALKVITKEIDFKKGLGETLHSDRLLQNSTNIWAQTSVSQQFLK